MVASHIPVDLLILTQARPQTVPVRLHNVQIHSIEVLATHHLALIVLSPKHLLWPLPLYVDHGHQFYRQCLRSIPTARIT